MFEKIENVLVIGGDMRSVYLANELEKNGYNVINHGFDFLDNFKTSGTLNEKIQQSQMIILPLPVTRDDENIFSPLSDECINMKEIFDCVTNNQIVFGGSFSKKLYKSIKDKSIKVYDYFSREELTVLNAIPTAEGAIEIAIKELPITLWRSECLITGYGRISKVLEKILTAMGASVTVAARKCSDRAWGNLMGSKSIKISEIDDEIQKYDVVFNTVPHIIFNEDLLKKMRKDSLIIDLASAPGGVDFEKAKEHSIPVEWALSLPGKVAPKSAGKIINDTILNILEEENL